MSTWDIKLKQKIRPLCSRYILYSTDSTLIWNMKAQNQCSLNSYCTQTNCYMQFNEFKELLSAILDKAKEILDSVDLKQSENFFKWN